MINDILILKAGHFVLLCNTWLIFVCVLCFKNWAWLTNNNGVNGILGTFVINNGTIFVYANVIE